MKWIIRFRIYEEGEPVISYYLSPLSSIMFPRWTGIKEYAATFKTKEDANFFAIPLARRLKIKDGLISGVILAIKKG